MKRAAVVIAAAVCIAAVAATATRGARTASTCSFANGIKHVVYLQFDNTHYRRDRPNIASDLEQMPHLLRFLKANGTLFTNDHTILIAHTAAGILASLTGLYPDRNGMTVANSYGYFTGSGVGFSSSFKYWTDPVDAVLDPKPNLVTLAGKNTPAPWVPFTRAGCDVGAVGVVNTVLENTSTSASGDMTRVFGAGSPEWAEAAASPAKAQADFVGIAVHCAQGAASRCSGDADAKPDLLPDEPGGYGGFEALFGAKYVDPAIAGGPCVKSTSGANIADPAGNCGFPGFDGMLAANTLGYVEQMQEHGVPVTYGYLSDAHDVHTADSKANTYHSAADGPGEAGHEAQLKAYDQAFAAFFSSLAAHGINRSNTLFVVTVDEGDHFTGGVGTPAFSHTNCFPVTSCPANQIGEVTASLPGLLPAGEPSFAVHSDSAPTVYVAGNPPRTDPSVRKLERDLAPIHLYDPYAGKNVPLMVAMADPIEMRALHMVSADPQRTPTFTYFANDDFFLTTSSPSCGGNPCVFPGSAWNHGDLQDEIGNTWVGFVGPGVATRGVDATTWTDHTNLRPTILSLLGLKDDYVEDGRVLTQALTHPTSAATVQLASLYEQLNAPFGRFARLTLAASTKAMAGDDAGYASTSSQIAKLTAQRDVVAGKIKTALWRAAFLGKPLHARSLLRRGAAVMRSASALPG